MMANFSSLSLRRVIACGGLFLLLLWALPVQAQWTNNQAAVNVIGQPNFTTNTPGLTASTFNVPVSVAVDPTTGKVFVTDTLNNRILRFSSAAAFANGQAAEGVLGQPNFTSGGTALTGSGFFVPAGISVDNNGRLWVADALNNRVLRFDSAAAKPNGAPADGVLGQINFTSNAVANPPTASSLRLPVDVVADAAGRLWVSDQDNHRVLRFDNAAAKPNGAPADGVLGQPNFTSNTVVNPPSAASLNVPQGIFVDSSGRLWVADANNNRVVRFDNAAAKPNGAPADGVLGQPNFTSDAAATTPSGMHGPVDAAVDPDGRLYIAEAINNRVLIFNNAAAKGNGANADNVLGQPNFISNTANNGGLSATSLNNPALLFFDPASSSLFVPDINNNRVLRFSIAQPSLLPSAQRTGSLLVFPYYTSTVDGTTDTRMTITNVSNAAPTAANQSYVHLFFIDGRTCQQADLFVCLTPNASVNFKASEYDPGNTGYVIAVAVNNQGVPVQNNVLMGNAFLRTPQIADNYGAETFWANSAGVATVNGNTATLAFDGVGYNAAPSQLAVEIQSPLDAIDQQIVTAGLSGDLTTGQVTGAAQIGTAQVFNEQEVFGSFNGWLTGTCTARGIISTGTPRVPNGLSKLIKTGQAGYMKFNVGGAVGLLLTPRGNGWTGIRALHKLQTTTTTLTIPIFVPVC